MTLTPLNNAKLKLAYPLSSTATSFYTVGQITKDSTSSAIIGEQIMTFSPNTTNEERCYHNISIAPTLHEDRSALGLENIYKYTITTRGIDNDNQLVPPTLYATTAQKSHSADDWVYFGIASEFFYTMLAAFEANVANRFAQFFCFNDITDVTVGDGRIYFQVPAKFDGDTLSIANATVLTAGTTGSTTIQIYNVTDSVDMLSTPITIASAATTGSGVIDATKDDVATGDILRIDVDTVSTTKPKGLVVNLEFSS